MTPNYRAIDASAFAHVVLAPREFGKPPTLAWIAIEDLLVDPTYQRKIERTGAKNIERIAEQFEWTKFAPVVVAPLEGKSANGRHVIIDGQHRTTAAKLRGFLKVPCQVVQAGAAAQAAAFAAINANVTKMSSMQLHAARAAAGDPRAVALARTCAKADVVILRHPVQTKNQAAGETMIAGALYRLLDKFGEAVLVKALSCITKTRKGNPGMVRAPLVEALCAVIEAEPEWAASDKLFPAMNRFDFYKAWNDAMRGGSGSSNGATPLLVDAIGDHLEKHLAGAAP